VSPQREILNAEHHARQTGPALEAAYRMLLWLIPAVDKFPRTQKYLLGERIQRTALDLLELLIAATYSKTRQAALEQANLCIEKLRILFRLAFDLRHTDLKRYEHAARQFDDLGRLIGGWRKADRAAQS